MPIGLVIDTPGGANFAGYSLVNVNHLEAVSLEADTLDLLQPTGVAPMTIASTTVVSNLNADLLDGQHGSYYRSATNIDSGLLSRAYGGTGINTMATVANSVLLGLAAGAGWEMRTLTAGSNVTFDKTVAGVLTINAAAGGGGGLSNAWAYFASSDGTVQLTASGSDTVRIAPGSNVTIGWNASPKTITISASTGSTTTSWPAGTQALPGWPVTGDLDTGFWSPSANQLAVVVGGVLAFGATSNGQLSVGPLGTIPTASHVKLAVLTNSYATQMEIGGGAGEGFLNATNGGMWLSWGRRFDGTDVRATQSSAASLAVESAGIVRIYADTALTAGFTFTHTERLRLGYVSATVSTVRAATGQWLALGAGGSDHLYINNTGTAFYPGTTNAISLGVSSNVFTAVWATNGTIQTSTRGKKNLIKKLQDSTALEAVELIPIWNYEYLDDPDPSRPMRHYGIVIEELPQWMWTDPDGKGFNYSTLASVNTAAIQALLRRVKLLEGKIKN